MPHPSSLPAALCPLSAFGVATLAASLVNTVQPRLFNSALARLASPQHNTTPKQPNNQTTKQPNNPPTNPPTNPSTSPSTNLNQPTPTYTNPHLLSSQFTATDAAAWRKQYPNVDLRASYWRVLVTVLTVLTEPAPAGTNGSLTKVQWWPWWVGL